ncbi:MAG: hypothetical protein RMI94_03645 [Bryobacterales bacterium]|nr:hypothetical protein [Bryobacteraceae bacterium]MDW8129617.1 hypothetical protein [Bryobacterales bacterium]
MTRENSHLCELCETRRARRACPGIRGQICSVCCGTEREVTVSCPLECPHLEEARRFEKLPPPGEDRQPTPEVELTEQFLDRNSALIGLAADTIARIALEVPGIVDSDVRDALDSLVRTYRTLETGLYYESLPANPLAGTIHRAVRQQLEERRRQIRQSHGMTPYRDADILGALVFLQRLHHISHNGRPRGRAFIHQLVRDWQRRREAARERSQGIILP